MLRKFIYGIFKNSLQIFSFVLISAVLWLVSTPENLLSQKNPYIGQIIRKIEFKGLVNVTKNSLYGKLTNKIGNRLQLLNISQDIKNLYATNYFSRIRVNGEILNDKNEGGIRLIYEFEEHPFIKKIEYIGFEKVSLTEIQSYLINKEGGAFLRRKLEDDQKTLRQKISDQGFPFAEVWVEVEESEKEKTEENLVKLRFFADSGDTIEVGKVNILGVRNVSIDKIRDLLTIEEASNVTESFFSEETFADDQQKILFFLKSQGFLDAEIDNQLSGYEIRWKNEKRPSDGRTILVNFAFKEKQRFFFAGYSVEYDLDYVNRENNPPEHLALGFPAQPLFTRSQLFNNLEYQETDVGSVFDEIKYLNDRSQIQNSYGSQGYIYVQAQPEIIDFKLNLRVLQNYQDCKSGKVRNRICKRIAEKLPLDDLMKLLKKNPSWQNRNFRHIFYTIRENFLAYVENIIIRGNEKTDESVIRREILIKEGQLFNSVLVNETRRRLINTRYFQEVNLELRPASRNNSMTIIFDVEEQATGTISLGAGLGTLSGFSVFAQIMENNLFGSGQQLSGRIEYGPLMNSLSIDWTDPWYFERCKVIGGGYWRKKMELLDEATSLAEFDFLIAEIAVEDSEIADKARKILKNVTQSRKRGQRLSIELLDATKVKMRETLSKYLSKEESCYRDVPKPWSLSIGVSLTNSIVTVQPIAVSFVGNSLAATYAFQRFRFSIGTSHAINAYWSHYHFYIPSFLGISNASALATDEVFARQRIGLQFTSTLRNGIVFNNIDNVVNPTSGVRTRFELDVTGGIFGGSDHFNRFTISNRFYFWWFDYSTKKNRSRKLKRYRVVQEFSIRSVFSAQTGPVYGRQDRVFNPYVEIDQRIYVGGTGSNAIGRLRGFDQTDLNYQPSEWSNGADHLLEFGTEIRFPIDPNIAWFVFFLDAVALFENISEYTGSSLTLLQNYQNNTVDASELANGSSFTDSIAWNDPRRLVLNTTNIALDRFLYTWGFGVRLQIPVFPLRIYFTQKLYYANSALRHIEAPGNYDIVIGLGDIDF